MTEEITTITLKVDTANKLRILKIKSSAKDLDQVVKDLLKNQKEIKQ